MESAAASAFLRCVMGRLLLVLEKEYSKHKGLTQETYSIQQDLRMVAAAMDDRLRNLGRGDLRTAVERLYSGVSDEDLCRVRSLTVFGKVGDAISCARKCKLLRVLDLEECDDLEDDHLKHIGKLWHLRYLSFGGTIRKLPRSIEGLHCLETLDLRRTKIKTVPI